MGTSLAPARSGHPIHRHQCRRSGTTIGATVGATLVAPPHRQTPSRKSPKASTSRAQRPDASRKEDQSLQTGSAGVPPARGPATRAPRIPPLPHPPRPPRLCAWTTQSTPRPTVSSKPCWALRTTATCSSIFSTPSSARTCPARSPRSTSSIRTKNANLSPLASKRSWDALVISGTPDTTHHRLGCRCDFSRTDSDAGATEVAPTLTGVQIVGNRLTPLLLWPWSNWRLIAVPPTLSVWLVNSRSSRCSMNPVTDAPITFPTGCKLRK